MKIKYRAEVDGLRAIAVISVIFYHSKFNFFGHNFFSGGFIGVDLFFVISGYLITSIILKELIRTGSLSFKYFYERRIRRILPVLLVVAFACSLFASVYLIPSRFVDFSKSILFLLGFSSNFYFWKTGQAYGAESGLLKPFLHTWSLSIEEQFYILFPIILLFTYKYLKKYLILILILGLVISLGLADLWSRNYPSFNFYILPTRVWEFLAGSVLACIRITPNNKDKYKRIFFILPSIGFFLVGCSILFFDDKIRHPSFYTFIPISGICLIICFADKKELVTKILSSKPLVAIGLISYSLYLWHYPVFSFSKIIGFTESNILKEFFLIIIILLLSVTSYYFIEKPSRNKKYKFVYILSLVLFFSFILIIINSTIILKKGLSDRRKLPQVINTQQSLEANWIFLLKNSDGENCYENIKTCTFNSSSNKKVLITGDSHMGSLIYNLKNRLVDKNYQFSTYVFGGCVYFPEFSRFNLKTSKIRDECPFRELEQILSRETNSIIIFGGRFPLHLTGSFFDNQEGGIENITIDENKWNTKYIPTGKYNTIEDSFKNEILKLSKNNKIILIYPIPEVGFDVYQKLFNSIPKKVSLISDYLIPKNFITTSYEVYKDRTKSSFQLLDSIQGKNIYRVFPDALFCDTIIKKRCLTHDEKFIFYRDSHHPSLKGAEMINDLIIKIIEEIELRTD